MNKSSEAPRHVILPLAVLGLSALAASAMIMMRPRVETQRPTVKAPLVRTAVIALGAETMEVESQGTVSPRTESQLVPEVSGRVTWVASSFVSGGFFEAGDVLLRVDPFDYEQALIAARAEVARSSVLLERERAEAELARTEWQELGRGDGSPLTLREPQIAEAQAVVEAAGANLQRAQRNLERTVVRAPYAGRVREKRVDVGQYITVGAPVATLYSIDVAEVRLPLADAELQYLELPLVYRGDRDDDGPAVTLTATFAGGTYEWDGRVVRTEGEIDPRNRMVHVVAQVENPYGRGPEPGRPPGCGNVRSRGDSRAHDRGRGQSSADRSAVGRQRLGRRRRRPPPDSRGGGAAHRQGARLRLRRAQRGGARLRLCARSRF